MKYTDNMHEHNIIHTHHKAKQKLNTDQRPDKGGI